MPLSSREFYEERARQYPDANVQFWEDIAELMGLYLMGREYVERYLDDRIRVKREAKMNIDDQLKEKILRYLDGAYHAYTA